MISQYLHNFLSKLLLLLKHRVGLQLKSLRQLTFVSFVVVLVPLAVLVAYSQVTLRNLTQIASNETEQSINIVRQVSKMENLSLDIERLVRQFTIVKNEALPELINTSINRFDTHQRYVCQQVPEKQNCEQLSARVDWIKHISAEIDPLLLDAQLADFKKNIKNLAQQVNRFLDIRLQNQQHYVNSVQQNQLWLTGILLGISVLLIILGVKAILNPIEKVEQVIRAISQQTSELPAISKTGPQELIVLEHQLHNLSSRLEKLEQLRTALLRHAAHELKTPLASIKEGCSLLTEQVVGPLNEQQTEVLSLLNSSTDRLNLLIIQLLDYNLLLQQASPEWELIDSEVMLKEFIQQNGLALKQHENGLLINNELPSIYADHKLFRRILDNLLSNALAHGSKGRPINIHIYQKGDLQYLDFANRGQKIPANTRSTLFQPFYRGDGARNDRVIGTGLGLSIVAECARMMFGKAEIVDVDYADVCVRVMIPVITPIKDLVRDPSTEASV
ncbi:HAMP domain-containing histidine kinase [Paraglaciecola aquimarina]|uniref:histidine kinase n=1 Tax=Paraglaciecola algarum TaxID=3050085 RepID=A0ABS9D1B8_9ALTE|nr:HAMP domain-containing sensor histidine kinase [Paraglaciecola sp. G1-23]MCF2946715.1 HAMP domain-containing histidine kinase [Paraglaciecola sp. G1-23]